MGGVGVKITTMFVAGAVVAIAVCSACQETAQIAESETFERSGFDSPGFAAEVTEPGRFHNAVLTSYYEHTEPGIKAREEFSTQVAAAINSAAPQFRATTVVDL